MASSPGTRRQPPAQALPAPEIGASGVIGSAAGSAAVASLVGTAAGVSATAPVVPLLKAGALTTEAILELLRRFFVLNRARQERWIVGMAGARVPQPDVLRLVGDENLRQAEFQRRVIERVRRDAAVALHLPPDQQRPAIEALLRREARYARQRSEAMAIRAIAMVDRVYLRGASPIGVTWTLDPSVARHTPGCVLLGGRALPWEAIDRLAPPVHAGCMCRLREPRKGESIMGVREALALVARAIAAEAAHHH